MQMLLFLLLFLFFAGSLVVSLFTGVLVAKGGYDAEIPFVSVVRFDRKPGTFAMVFALYSFLSFLSGSILLELMGLIDVSYFTPSP